MIPPRRIDEICSRFGNKKILVYGDVILDRYIFGFVERISPEAPVPVVRVTREESRLGGAGNVAANIDRLGAEGLLMGVVGDDPYGAEALRLKAGSSHVRSDRLNTTVVKTRIVAEKQQMVRLDREMPITVDETLEQEMTKTIAGLKIDGIIVSDYAKGTVTEGIMKALKDRALELKIHLVVDPKPGHAALYRGVSGVTPNLKEAEEMLQKKLDSEERLRRGVTVMRNRLNVDYVIITRGSQGISAGERGGRVFHLPAFSREVFDVTGAGDTVTAVLTLALTAGASLREAVSMANAAASIVVERVGTGQVSVAELKARLKWLRKKSG